MKEVLGNKHRLVRFCHAALVKMIKKYRRSSDRWLVTVSGQRVQNHTDKSRATRKCFIGSTEYCNEATPIGRTWHFTLLRLALFPPISCGSSFCLFPCFFVLRCTLLHYPYIDRNGSALVALLNLNDFTSVRDTNFKSACAFTLGWHFLPQQSQDFLQEIQHMISRKERH